jgi:hypothetical protein
MEEAFADGRLACDQDEMEMRQIGRLLLLGLPYLVFGIYADLLLDYSKYLDRNLRYMPSAVAGVPEDILGLGFWFTWSIFLAFFLTACAIVYKTTTRKRTYFAVVALCFAVLSIIDYWLYDALSRQVLAQ